VAAQDLRTITLRNGGQTHDFAVRRDHAGRESSWSGYADTPRDATLTARGDHADGSVLTLQIDVQGGRATYLWFQMRAPDGQSWDGSSNDGMSVTLTRMQVEWPWLRIAGDYSGPVGAAGAATRASPVRGRFDLRLPLQDSAPTPPS